MSINLLNYTNLFYSSLWRNLHRWLEVFTLPPYSTWNPYGFHVIPDGFHPFHMEYVLAGITAISAIPFHLECHGKKKLPKKEICRAFLLDPAYEKLC